METANITAFGSLAFGDNETTLPMSIWPTADDNLTTNETTAKPILTDPKVEFALDMYAISTLAYFYGRPIVVIIGLIANSLVIAVVVTSAMKATTVGHYMLGTAIADNIDLLCQAFTWFDDSHLGIYLLANNNAICKLTYGFSYVARLWSALILCIITIERFVVVAFPLKVGKIMTTKIAKINIIVTGIFSLCINSHVLVTIGATEYYSPGTPSCNILPQQVNLYATMTLIVQTSIEEIFSISLMSIFSCLIIFKLARAKSFRAGTASQGQGQTQANKSSKETQVTIMLLSVILAFLFCKIPYSILWTFQNYKAQINKELDIVTQYNVWTAMWYASILSILNHGINLFLYAFFGSTFRQHLKELISCKKITSSNQRSTQLSSLDSKP